MTNPDTWPQWPWLPVKKPAKSGGMPTCGLIFCSEPSTVYEGNLFVLPKNEEAFNALPKHEYTTIEALQADGWIID